MKKQKNQTIQLTLLPQVIQTVIRHKTIIFITALISLLYAGLIEGFTFLLEPHSSTLFPTVDSVPYPQYIGTWTLVYTIMDILTAISTVGFTLIPLALIYKAEHPDAAPIGIDLLSSTREILILLLLSLLTSLPKHLINCGYDIIQQMDAPKLWYLPLALVDIIQGIGRIYLPFYKLPKMTAEIAASQQSFAPIDRLQTAVVSVMIICITVLANGFLQNLTFPFSLIQTIVSGFCSLLLPIMWYRSSLPTEA